ncbi:hypothetical protein ABMY26_25605 [Azospirillum sp. HJ39]|uniref:hypothetical protein n=1 Tax=Azospirillum sp. HJ39 TaxID=3159496 RepID=UPI003559034F
MRKMGAAERTGWRGKATSGGAGIAPRLGLHRPPSMDATADCVVRPRIEADSTASAWVRAGCRLADDRTGGDG